MNDPVFLGRQGESGVCLVTFDIVEELGQQYASVKLRVRRPSEFSFYEPTTTIQDGKVIWPIGAGDTINAGHGEVQLVADAGVAFGPIHPTVIFRSLTIQNSGGSQAALYRHLLVFEGEKGDEVNTESIRVAFTIISFSADPITLDNYFDVLRDDVFAVVGSGHVQGAGINKNYYSGYFDGDIKFCYYSDMNTAGEEGLETFTENASLTDHVALV